MDNQGEASPRSEPVDGPVRTSAPTYTPVPPAADRRPLDNRRVKARVVDFGLLFLVYLLVIIYARDHGGWHPGYFWGLLWLEVTYFFVCEAAFERTLGKRQYGLRVVRASDGGMPNLNAIAARNIIRVVEEPVIALLTMVGSRKRRQRVGDLVAGTAVVEDDGLPGPGFEFAIAVYPALWGVGAALFVAFMLPSTDDSPAPSLVYGNGDPPSQSAPPLASYTPTNPPADGVVVFSDPFEFIAQAESICDSTFKRAQAAELREKAARGRKQLGDQAQSLRLRYKAIAYQGIVLDFRTLGTPPRHARLFDRLHENFDRRWRLYEAASDANTNGNKKRFDAISQRIAALDESAVQMGRRFGLSECNSRAGSSFLGGRAIN